MKKILIYMILPFLFSCNKYSEYYDVEAPKLNFSAQKGEKVLFQFDEPVKELKCNMNFSGSEKTTGVTNDFPVSNIYIDKDFFKVKDKTAKNADLTLEVRDNKDNVEKIKVSLPAINDNPAELIISDVQLKYSAKKPQNFIIKSVKGGNLLGYSICFYVLSDLYEYFFDEETIKAGTSLKISIMPDKAKFIKNGNIKFSAGQVKLTTKMRISPSSSLICIKMQDYDIKDYILYFDSKTHPLDYYLNKKGFKDMINLLNSFDIEPVYVDIKGNTVKKHIVRYKNKFVVNSNG